MRCDGCIAMKNDCGPERDATEWWCAVGEEEREFSDGSMGCARRSVEKLKRDMKIQADIDNQAFAEECGRFVDYVESCTG